MNEVDIPRVERLDQYVISKQPSFTRSHAVKLIEQGRVLVNNKPQLKAGYKLRPKDNIVINFDENEKINIPEIDLEIVYEDNDCIVINKPVGILTHSKGAYNPEATVATWLSARIKGIDEERAGIVHRLDRATSGVMILAKNADSLSWLQKQFSQRRTKKQYIAITQGIFKQLEAEIDMPIERNPKKPQTFRVGSNGKSASTTYKVIDSSDKYSFVRLRPFTGRTHQLRVHLAQLGHPIVGDQLYGGERADRLYLHAESLEITLPDKRRKTFSVKVPKQFNNFMESK